MIETSAKVPSRTSSDNLSWYWLVYARYQLLRHWYRFPDVDRTHIHGMRPAEIHCRQLTVGCMGLVDLVRTDFFGSDWFVSSWWFQPIWKICSSNWIIYPNRDEHIKNLWTPPTSYVDENLTTEIDLKCMLNDSCQMLNAICPANSCIWIVSDWC